MPKKLEKVVDKLREKGMPRDKAYAIGTAALQKAGKLRKAKKR